MSLDLIGQNSLPTDGQVSSLQELGLAEELGLGGGWTAIILDVPVNNLFGY